MIHILKSAEVIKRLQDDGDIDLSRIRPKAVRLNITLAQPLARRIDAYAKAHGESRSGFLARAAQQAMASQTAAPRLR